jgi:acyl-CoA thioester hydrolase
VPRRSISRILSHVPQEYDYEFDVPADAIDANGHVNNVEYVRWMQEAATRHFESAGGEPLLRAAGASWVVRSHRVEYLRPAMPGDRVRVKTWVADFRRVQSLRKYEFSRADDGTVLARGETEWVFVDATTGRPKSIPENLRALLPATE